jgi:dihydrofolate reductase
MGKLIYSALTSLDLYLEDEEGKFDWAVPDDEVHGFINDLERSVGTYLLGRRMYETMAVWDDFDAFEDQSRVMRDFAEIWRAADKIVYSGTLPSVSGPKTRLERHFNPEEVARMKASAERDLNIGGPGLATHAIRAGLVDELCLFLMPILVGGGKPALPDGVRSKLELVDERRFAGGTIYLRYRAGG